MEENSIKKYLSIDYARALKFYDEKAKFSKRCYRALSIYLIVVSAGLTPIVAFMHDNIYWRVIGSILSATIVIATGLMAHLKCHENWLSYRFSWDALERERRSYETCAGEYKTAIDKDILFVERVEAILTKEGSEYYARHAKNKDNSDKLSI